MKSDLMASDFIAAFPSPLSEASLSPTPWDDSSSQPSSTATLAFEIHHGLDGLAGFYRDEAEARAVADQLVSTLNWPPHHLALLGPSNGTWIRFAMRARQWNRRPYQRDPSRPRSVGVAALVGTLLATAVANSGLLPRDIVNFAPEPLGDLLTALAGAIIGAGLFGSLHRQQPQFRPFDRLLRRKLGEGCWVVVVHDLKWSLQARAVELIRRHGRNWTAVSSASQR